ncbi:hypothetical protein I35_2111 [Burkholderia cenocepacia H111]|nr:uncharacterized protein BCN122_I1970 [Burkholderia cenocepacia]CDN60634.1 hypothetical protein I35_2111 [Burkholderia cenocepacia H111]
MSAKAGDQDRELGAGVPCVVPTEYEAWDWRESRGANASRPRSIRREQVLKPDSRRPRSMGRE